MSETTAENANVKNIEIFLGVMLGFYTDLSHFDIGGGIEFVPTSLDFGCFRQLQNNIHIDGNFSSQNLSFHIYESACSGSFTL